MRKNIVECRDDMDGKASPSSMTRGRRCSIGKGRFFSLVVVLLILVLIASIFPSCEKSESSYVSYTLKIKEDGTFRILQLTDLHFIDSEETSTTVVDDLTLRDEWVQTAVTDIVERANPDMIIVTGDSIFTNNLISLITGTNDNYKAFQKASRFIDSFKIPWAFVFGNHDEEGSLIDSEGSAEEAKALLAAYLKSDELKHCLFAEGPSGITGCGNYIVNVLDRDGSVHTSLVLLDSGSYISVYDESTGETLGDQWKYEYVHDDQLDWYEKAIRDISRKEGRLVTSMIFQHIPVLAYETAFNAYRDALEAMGENWRDTIKADREYGIDRTLMTEKGEITYHGGVCNKENQQICHPFIGTYGGVSFDGGHEFERVLSLGSTKYIFCGHDHRNTFSFTYQGVRLTYGMSIDYSAVGLTPPPLAQNQNIYDETEQRGGTLITLKEGGIREVTQIPFTRNLYRETVKERGVKK